MNAGAAERTRTATWKLATVALLVSVAISIAAAELFFQWYANSLSHSSKMERGMMRYHPTLGWTLTPSWLGRHKHHDFDVSYRINTSGFRGENLERGKKRRIAFVGDSFTFGIGVGESKTFAAILQAQSDNRYLNLGVPGYSTDQQYLYLKRYGRSFKLDHIILAVYLGNDLLDNNYPFPLQANKAKPYFTADDNGLTLRNTPVPRGKSKPDSLKRQTMGSIAFGTEFLHNRTLWARLRSKSLILQRVTPAPKLDSEEELEAVLSKRLQVHKDLFVGILRNITSLTENNEQSISIALLPGRSFVCQTDRYSLIYQNHIREFILETGREMDIPVVDVALKMQTHKQEFPRSLLFFPNEGHFTEEGHQLVADILMSATP